MLQNFLDDFSNLSENEYTWNMIKYYKKLNKEGKILG